MRRLAVFDIDGTLTDTNAVDEECYFRAVAEVLGLDAAVLDWSEAPLPPCRNPPAPSTTATATA